MKKDRKIFETPLLFSQEEMALLLGVTRSTWSMYVSGLRNIPTDATVKLAKLLQSAAQLPLATPELSHRTVQEGKKKEMLQEELAKNKWETEVLERKLAKMQKQFQEAENTLQFVQVHESQGDLNEQEVCILQNVKNRALAQVEKNGLQLQANTNVNCSLSNYTKSNWKKKVGISCKSKLTSLLPFFRSIQNG